MEKDKDLTKALLEDLGDSLYTKKTADAFLDLDIACKTMTIAEISEDLNIDLTPYANGRFVELEGNYILFEDLFMWLLEAGYYSKEGSSEEEDSDEDTYIITLDSSLPQA